METSKSKQCDRRVESKAPNSSTLAMMKRNQGDSKTKGQSVQKGPNFTKPKQSKVKSETKTAVESEARQLTGTGNSERRRDVGKIKTEHGKSKMYKVDPNVKTLSSNQTSKHPTSLAAENTPDKHRILEEISMEDKQIDEYEDDFEDYEEDFEEDLEQELTDGGLSDEAAASDLGSKHQENRVLISRDNKSLRKPEQSMDKKESNQNGVKLNEEGKVGESMYRGYTEQQGKKTIRIDFRKASLTEAQLSAIKRAQDRYEDLKDMIDLDTVRFDILETTPIKDYDFFMLSHGKGNRKQVKQQTGDDCQSREVQTEESDFANRWVQFPAIGPCSSGGDEFDVPDVQARQGGNGITLSNSHSLLRFVAKAGKLFEQLLNDQLSGSSVSFKLRSNKHFSDSFCLISLDELAEEYETRDCTLPADSNSPILTVHYMKKADAQNLTDAGLICVWNIHDLDAPQMILHRNAAVRCSCFSPDLISAVFCGCDDNSLIAWDLTEPDTSHKAIRWKDKIISLRSPSYDTASLKEDKEEKVGPIVSLKVLNTYSDSIPRATQTNYQIAALNACGLITIWTVLTGIRAIYGSISSTDDLGLKLGSRLKIVKAESIDSTNIVRHSIGGPELMRVHCMTNESGNFFVGADNGCILRTSRHQGSKSGPSLYHPQFSSMADVLCLSFSPFNRSVVLAGLSDGSLYAYKIGLYKPLTNFALGIRSDPINAVQWSPCNPYVFYSLHGSELICEWNLRVNKTGPVNVESVTGCTKIFLPTELTNGRIACMALTFKNGSVELYCLKSDGAVYTNEDGQKLSAIIQRLC